MESINKFLILGLLLIMTMSVTMAADVSEESSDDIIISSIETTQEATTETVATESDCSCDTNIPTQNFTTTQTQTINDTDSYSSTIEHNMGEVNNENIKGTEKISKTIAMDSTNFDDYVTNGKFNEKVSDGDTIDIQGKLDGSRFSVDIDKPLNIISSTGDAYYNSHTSKIGTTEDYTNIFTVSNGGSGTNITGITFYNTQVRIENASNVKIDNIKLLNIDQSIGQGVGAFTVREGSENITVTNSYFKTIGNGGHSNVVFAAAYNCLFENNTIEGDGNHGLIGNLLYLTTYNVKYANPATNINITIRNNDIRVYNVHTMATCWGLVLEGNGHRIENNYIDNPLYSVKAQYADVDYGFETNINEIILNNNTLVGGTAELTFPGIVANNTFNERAILKQMHAYNNVFNIVTIENNVIFENNIAKQVIIAGNNNLLDYNEIYSDADYAVTINDKNNTLTNNKLAGYLGRGENAITNSTEIISLNNSEDINRVFYINDDNFDKYFIYRGLSAGKPYYDVNNGIFHSGDILIFNNINITDVTIADKNKVFAKTDSLTIINSTNSISIDIVQTVINCRILPEKTMGGTTQTYVINSTVYKTMRTPTEVINSTIFVYNKEYTYPKENIYAGDTLIYQGFTIDNLPASSIVYIMKQYVDTEPIIITDKITIEGLFEEASLVNEVNFVKGASQSIINGITFKSNVLINDSIEFNNCIFEDNVEVYGDFVTFNNCIFNSNITLNSANSLLFNNNTIISGNSINVTSSNRITIENNIITTTSENTIVFDDESSSNVVKNNILIANTLLGDDSVIGGDNIVEDNGASYNASIEIVADDLLFKNDKSNVTITVYNLLNNTPVDKGYVEVYLDGILQGIKPLVNGQVTLEINTEKSSIGTVPLKVWYYDGIRYANNVTSINVNVVKSNVSINVDEFTAKLNEKATITSTFINNKGNPVMDTNVTFTVGRSNYITETVDGVATIEEMVTKEWLDAGKITISFPATDAYNSNTTSILMNTSKDDVLVVPEVTRSGSTVDIRLSLTDSLGAVVTDGRINITTLDGQQLASGRVSNGVYTTTVTLPNDYASDYLLANYTDKYYYNGFERQVKLSSMLNSSVSIVTNSPVLGEDLEISGKLTDSTGAGISGAALEISVNGEKTSTTTAADGEYNVTTTPILGENVITVTFDGTIDYYASSGNVTVEVLNVSRDIKDLLDQIEELQKENKQLQDENSNLTEQLNNTTNKVNDLTNKLNTANDKISTLNTTNKALTQQLNDANGKIDSLTKANNNLNSQLADTNKKLDALNSTNRALTQQLSDTNKKLDDLSRVVDGLNKQLSDSQKQINDLNKSVSSKDAQIRELTTKKNTKITVNKVNATRYGDNVVISGTLADTTGTVIANMPVSVKVNNAETKVVTNNKGVYTLSKATSMVGTNNVTVSFAGDSKYNGATGKTTFKVNKQDLKISINSIKSVRFKDNVTITGTMADANGKVIANTALNLSINGKKVKVKTGKDGLFTYTTTAKKIGTSNVTASYAGNAKYNKASAKATFKVTKQDLVLTVDRVFSSIRYKDDMEISGKLVDGNGKAVANTMVSVKVNDKTYKAKTDKNGVYVLEIRATSMGTNNVTVSYAGNAKYNKVSAKATFKVAKQDLIIGFDSVTYSNGKITVKGTFTDRNRHALMNSVARITINGKTGTAKTNTNGTFTYTTNGKQGVLKLTLAYPGNARYNAYSKTSTINV